MTTPITSSPSNSTAFLVHRDVLYFTRNLQYPVGALIEGVWALVPDQARAITRNRIFSSHPLTHLCEGMLMVAAKRSSYFDSEVYQQKFLATSHLSRIEVSLPGTEIFPSLRSIPSESLSEDQAMETAERLAKNSSLGIAAVLLDEDKKIVSYGWNNHFPNKILHAEIMLVKNFVAQYKSIIPKNYTLISTLQPCAMCAGYLHQHCEDFNSLKIIYKDTDPGKFAQNSILVPGSYLYKKRFLDSISK